MDVDADVAMNAESATDAALDAEAVAPEGEEAFEEPKLKFDSDAEDDIWPKLSIEPVLNPMESSEELEDKQEEDIWPQPKLAPEASTESASSVPAAFATSAPAKSATTPAAPTDAPVAPAAPVALAKPAATPATAPISTAPVAPAKPVAESAAKPVAASYSAATSEIEPAPTAIPTPAMPTPVAAPEPAVPTASSTESAPSAPASPEPAPLPLQKVMPKKDNATPNDHHIANFKKMNRIASRPSVANDKKVSAGSFVAYKPASSR